MVLNGVLQPALTVQEAMKLIQHVLILTLAELQCCLDFPLKSRFDWVEGVVVNRENTLLE